MKLLTIGHDEAGGHQLEVILEKDDIGTGIGKAIIDDAINIE